MNLSIIVPAYNSEQSLPELAEQLEPVLTSVATQYELILVNDGSSDHSWEIIEQLSERYSWIRPINLMRNFGQHNALLCGIRKARYDIVVTMDDDLQHPPEEIPKLLDKLQEGFDVVYGIPEHEQHGFWRDISSKISKLVLQRSMNAEIARNISAFRVFRTEVRQAFANFNAPLLSIDVLLTWGTTRFGAVRVRHERRQLGTSHYTFRMLLNHALNMMTGFSTLPLQVASWAGFSFMLFGLCVLILVIVRYLIQGTPQPGFSFLASIIALFSGVQLFSLGIIGEYLARVHTRIMEKPPYVQRTVTDKSPIKKVLLDTGHEPKTGQE